MTVPTSPLPAATILGYPRIGPDRELKRAVESYWKGDLDVCASVPPTCAPPPARACAGWV